MDCAATPSRRCWFSVLNAALLAAAIRSLVAAAEPPAASQPLSLDLGPIVTDRPDFTESPLVVPAGSIQLESGYTFTHDNEGTDRRSEHTLPEFLLRAGLTRDVELRLAWLGWSFTDERFLEEDDRGRDVWRNPHESDTNDFSAGFKFQLAREEGWIPDLAVIADITMPTGSERVSSGDVDPTVKILIGHSVTETVYVASNVNMRVASDELGRFFQVEGSISLGAELFEDVGGYVEYFFIAPNERGVDVAHYLDGGLTYQLTPVVQFDWRIGMGLNEEADDLFTGVGLSVRLDPPKQDR